jgi:hypothetical protein
MPAWIFSSCQACVSRYAAMASAAMKDLLRLVLRASSSRRSRAARLSLTVRVVDSAIWPCVRLSTSKHNSTQHGNCRAQSAIPELGVRPDRPSPVPIPSVALGCRRRGAHLWLAPRRRHPRATDRRTGVWPRGVRSRRRLAFRRVGKLSYQTDTRQSFFLSSPALLELEGGA